MNDKLLTTFILLLVFILSLTFKTIGVVNDKFTPLTKEEKIADFHYLYNILKKNYPLFWVLKRKSNYDWLSHREEFEEMIKATKDNIEFYDRLSYIVSKLNNGHTSVIKPRSYIYYTKYLYSSNKIYKPWFEILNNEKSKVFYKNLFNYQVKNGEIKNYPEKENVDIKIIKNNEIAYVKIHSFENQYIEKDANILNKFWREIQNYLYLIIDIRGNGGGSNDYWVHNIVGDINYRKNVRLTKYQIYRGGEYSKAFIKAISDDKLDPIEKLPSELNYPPEIKNKFKFFSEGFIEFGGLGSVPFHGKIYVLINSKVFSSAELFSVFCKQSGWAILVGEQTDGNGIGNDPIFVALPNSGIIIRFPMQMGLNSDGRSNEEFPTTPDIKSENPLNEVLNIINNK